MERETRYKKNKELAQSIQLGGKLPPQAIDVEEIILGGLMLEKDAINNAIEILTTEAAFYKPEHAEIFISIKSLFGRNQPVDLITVTSDLRQRGMLDFVGGPLYLSELTNRVGSAANIEYYCRIIFEHHIKRELIKISSEIITAGYDETSDVFEILDKAESKILTITDDFMSSASKSIGDIVGKAVDQIQETMTKSISGDGFIGVPSGFAQLDKITSGFQKSDLIIVAARPGMGKTAFVLSLARNAAVTYGKSVAFFSLEMSSLQLVLRLISGEAQIDSEKIRSGKLEQFEMAQLQMNAQKLGEAKLFIDDTPALKVFDLRAKCRRLKLQHKIDLIIIDYLQLMQGNSDNMGFGGNREQEISQISRTLKQIAKELDVPVIALSQLSREVEKRAGTKKPMLSDLRESGSIEQDADQVMFIYRPEYYKLTEYEDGSPTHNTGEIIIAKNRHGSLTEVKLAYISKFAKFANLEEDNPFGNSNDPLSSFGGLPPETHQNGNLKLGSKMNDSTEDDEIPF